MAANTEQTITLGRGKFYVEGGYDPSVKVPSEVLRCVAFIGEVSHRDEQGNVSGDLLASGFFVNVPSVVFPGLKFAYFVTARHVADDLKGRELYIIVNGKEGKSVTLTQFNPHWWFHPTDETADLAVLQVAEQQNIETWAVPIKDFLTAEDIAAERASVGDEVFMIGLFTEAPGQKRNVPIVRLGSVAMFPEEQIQTELGYADVYLVEARSIGGLSGSPAFVRTTMTVPITLNDGSKANLSGVGRFRLMGLMHGHWDIKESEKNKAAIVHDRKHGVNLGIGIVVPALKILETLNQPDLVAYRQESDEDMGKRKKSVPGMDSAKKKELEPTNFTQEDFENALKKVSRKTEPKS